MSIPKVLSSVNPMQQAVNQEPVCIICLANTKPIEKFQGSCKCRPDIHIKCMDAWLTKNSKTCPICRQKYPETYIQKEENEQSQQRANQEQESCAFSVCCCCFICLSVLQGLH